MLCDSFFALADYRRKPHVAGEAVSCLVEATERAFVDTARQVRGLRNGRQCPGAMGEGCIAQLWNLFKAVTRCAGT